MGSVRISRRVFLGAGLLGPVGFWASGAVQSSHAQAPSDKLNIAVIGCGGRGAANLKAVSSQNIVALCDVDEERLAAAAKDFPKARRYCDFRQMFDEMHSAIDAVVVSTPDHTHAPASVLAMNLGKHVYCEKPLCHSIYEARRMAEVAAKTKVATQMGNQHHWGYRRPVEIVRSGLLGTIREVHAWSDRNFSGGNRPKETPPVPAHLKWDIWLGPAPARPYHPVYHPFRWRGWWDFGTGSLGDMGCHICDPAVWALELDKATTITVTAEGPPVHPESTPAWAIVRYTFPPRGKLPTVTVIWYHGGKLPPKDVAGDMKLPSNGSLFVGEKGKLLVPHGGHPSVFPEDLQADLQKIKGTISAPATSHHAEWLQACKTGQTTGSNFAYAARLTEIVLLGNVAYRVGKPIEWEVATMRAKNCSEASQFVRRDYRKGWTL
ncbi:Inositol 2-dehydrogenase [bacterium HR36]|nr:Inositol 2-dehydrogenase [bacterium HR36]